MTDIKVIGLDEPLIDVVMLLENLPNDTLIYAIGNQVGAGQEILQLIAEYRHHG